MAIDDFPNPKKDDVHDLHTLKSAGTGQPVLTVHVCYICRGKGEIPCTRAVATGFFAGRHEACDRSCAPGSGCKRCHMCDPRGMRACPRCRTER